MSKKIKDLAVKVGEKNWVNIGCIIEKDDGGKFMLMNRTFNPAGVPNPENRDTLIVSMFDVKPKDESAADKVSDAFNGEEVPF
jgi:hypothetical protein